jgi:hypothetical protein
MQSFPRIGTADQVFFPRIGNLTDNFPRLGKTAAVFSKAWMARGAPQDFSVGSFQALEKANQNNHRSHGRKRFSVVRVIRG